MKPYDDTELRELLLCYDVSGPSPDLTARTTRLMREEALKTAVAPVRQEKWVFLLVGLAVAMSLCLFYMFTVGTILSIVLPPVLQDFLRHTIYALTAAGGSLLTCALMMLICKQLCLQDVGERLSSP